MISVSVPSFLLVDVSANSNDRKRLISDLQRFCLWRTVYGDKPYNHEDAVKLQKMLCAQHQARQLKQAKRRSIDQEKLEKESVELHRKLVEAVLSVTLLADIRAQVEPTGELNWDTKIRDAVTKVSVGTPRTLMAEYGFEWRRNTDARVDLERYLDELRHAYHDFSYSFSFRRKFLKPKFGEYKDTHLSFRLVLTWTPSTVGEVSKKLRGLLTQTSR